MKITMKYGGRFRGAISGRVILHEPYEVLDLPNGEFAHLDKVDYMTGEIKKPDSPPTRRKNWKLQQEQIINL